MSAMRAAIADRPSIAADTSAAQPTASGDANQPLPDEVGRPADATCPRCATAFTCGASATSCWCQSLPAIDLARRAPDMVASGCLCGGCLGAVVAEQLAA